MDIKEMNAKDVFKMYIDDIKKIRKNYDIFMIPEQDFIKYVLVIIKKSQQQYQDGDFKTYVISMIKMALSKKINQLLSDDNYCYNIMSNYINNQFSKTNDYDDCIDNFNEINNFINRIGFMPNSNIIYKLISNNTLIYNNLDVIYKKHKEQIDNGKLNILFNNYFMIVCLEAYCNMNNIVIKDEVIIEKNDNINLTDSLKMYLQDIGKYKILTFDEEQELFARLENGDEEARKIIIERNLKLVVSIAFKYSKLNIPVQDLIAEGNIGLMYAIKKFDRHKGFKFSTYAKWWIQETITKYISYNRHTIRVPYHIAEKIGLYRQAYSILYNKYNEVPSRKAIAEYMKISEVLVEKIEHNVNDTVSLDSLITEDEDDTLESMISDSSEKSPEEAAIEHLMVEDIGNIVESLISNERERDIIKLRFGMNEEERCYSLEEIGKKYHLTRERIRQIEKRILWKLSNNSKCRNLIGYLDNPSSIIKR